MSQVREIKAVARDRAGKGSSRALRRQGFTPCVIYGDKKDPILLAVTQKELVKEYQQTGFFTHVFALEVEGKKHKVLARDIQLHPVTDMPLHADFLRVSDQTKINVEIPVHFINQEKSTGLKRGGVLNIVRHSIECECFAGNIPETIDINLEGTNIGDSIHISHVKLPEGIEPVVKDRDFTIATLAAPTVMKDVGETTEGAEAGESEEKED